MKKFQRLGFSVLFILIFSLARGQAGSLDVSFSGDGKDVTSFGAPSRAPSIAVQSDRKAVLAGYTGNIGSNLDVAVVRYNTDGTLDASFDGDGKVTTAVGSGADAAFSAKIQTDGKIVVAGYTQVSGYGNELLLLRYNPDGSLDNSFDGDGKVITTISTTTDDGISDMVLQPDGKIVVTGWSNTSSSFSMFVSRYNPDGSLDNSFGNTGFFTYTQNGITAQSINLRPDGKIVIAGHYMNPFNATYDFMALRLLANGAIDIGFDGDGFVAVDFGGTSDIANSAVVFVGNRLYIGGRANSNMAICRLLDNGSPDNSFDGDGKLITGIASNSYVQDLALQWNNQLLVAGATTNGGSTFMHAILRVNPNGTLDAAFDGDGKVITSFGSESVGDEIALVGNRIFVGGVAGNQFGVAVYLNDVCANPVSNNSLNASGNMFFCGGPADPPVINGTTPAGGNGVYAYQWQQGTDGINFTDISGATGISYDPGSLSSTTYFRRVVHSDGCSYNSSFISAIIATVVPAPSIIADGRGEVCPGDFKTLISSNYRFTNRWFKDGVFIGTGEVEYVNSPGSYTVAIQEGTTCSNQSAPKIITAASSCEGWVPNASLNNEVMVSPGHQTLIKTVSDGFDGVFTLWLDQPTGKLLVQKTSRLGQRQWPLQGVRVCMSTGEQIQPDITSDGRGGAVITWTDKRADPIWKVYAQRIDAEGNRQWGDNGLLVENNAGSSSGNSQLLRVSSSSDWDVFICWVDSRHGLENIYAQRLNINAVVQWAANGVRVCAQANQQLKPILTYAFSGFTTHIIIAWEEERSLIRGLYAQKLNSSGVPQWNGNGVTVSSLSLGTTGISTKGIAADNSGGAVLVWQDARGGANADDIYAQSINTSGVPQWAANGIAVCNASGLQGNLKVVPDFAGGAVIAWQDGRSGSPDIYAQLLLANGTVQWTSNGLPVCTATGNQTYPDMIPYGSGGATIVWSDSRNRVFPDNNYDIYAQQVNSSGALSWATNGVPVSTNAGYQFIPYIIQSSGSAGIITWNDYRASMSDADIYASKLMYSGILPLRLLQFSGRLGAANTADLTWQTENEINTSHFELEYAKDGESFTQVARVPARPNSIGSQQYGVRHPLNTGTKHFFRLKMVDNDGRYTYSSILPLRTTFAAGPASVFPNPAQNRLQVNLSLSVREVLQCQVIDAVGRIVLSQTKSFGPGQTIFELPIEKLGSGVYTLRLAGSSLQESLSFIKQ